MGSKYSNRTVTAGVKNVQKSAKKANWGSNQGPPSLSPYGLTTQPLLPFLLTVLHFCFINGFFTLIRRIVDIVKIYMRF